MIIWIVAAGARIYKIQRTYTEKEFNNIKNTIIKQLHGLETAFGYVAFEVKYDKIKKNDRLYGIVVNIVVWRWREFGLYICQ